jgi:uncharacterized membrane protein
MEFLSGLHPKVVHFPIAFLILYFIFESLGTVLKKEYFTKASVLILTIGVLTALLAVLTGNQAHEVVKQISKINSNDLNQFIEQHENFATWAMWYFTALLFFRIYLLVKKKFNLKFQYLFILLGAIGCLLILLAGYYGGQLVFDHGIGTQLFGK